MASGSHGLVLITWGVSQKSTIPWLCLFSAATRGAQSVLLLSPEPLQLQDPNRKSVEMVDVCAYHMALSCCH